MNELFVLCPQKLFVNFDPQILELIQEAKCMRRLNLEVNKNMESMVVNDDYLFYKATERTHLLEIFSQIVTAFSTSAQVITEMCALLLVEDWVISRCNHLARGNYSRSAKFPKNRLALLSVLPGKLSTR